MPRYRVLRCVVVFALLASVAGCRRGPFRTIPVTGVGIPAFDRPIKMFMAVMDVPGGAYAVARDGRLVLSAGYGHADLARTQPVRPDHLFRVASLSKPITAVAVLLAAEQGRLDLDAPIITHISDLFPSEGPLDPRFQRITPRHLLSHSSGITRDSILRTRDAAALAGETNPPSSEAVVILAASESLGFEPGTSIRYSNTGYATLGRVLERATGVPYEDYVRTKVLAPADIQHASVGGPRQQDRLPNEVEYDSRGQRWNSIFDNEGLVDAAYGAIHLRGFDAASGWVMSVEDLARFGASVDGHPGRPDLLTPASHALMIADAAPPGFSDQGAAWHLRWVEADGARHRLWEHSGGMPGTSAYLSIRADGLVVAAVLNTWDKDGRVLNAFRSSLDKAIDAVEVWPDRDLFP